MLFEVINNAGHTVFVTSETICLPEERHIKSMSENGYKFKLDGKILSKKSLNELIKQKENK